MSQPASSQSFNNILHSSSEIWRGPCPSESCRLHANLEPRSKWRLHVAPQPVCTPPLITAEMLKGPKASARLARGTRGEAAGGGAGGGGAVSTTAAAATASSASSSCTKSACASDSPLSSLQTDSRSAGAATNAAMPSGEATAPACRAPGSAAGAATGQPTAGAARTAGGDPNPLAANTLKQSCIARLRRSASSSQASVYPRGSAKLGGNMPGPGLQF